MIGTKRWLSEYGAIFLGGLLTLFSPSMVLAAKVVTYYMTDPQGTVIATTDSSGAVLSTADYRPFGSQVVGATVDGPGFTGHVPDSESEFTYMQARYYDQGTGRFISPDPLDLAAGSGFTFNRFSYVANNPTSLIDPTGLFAEGMSGAEINCAVYHCEIIGPGDTARAQRGIRAANMANSSLQSAGVAGTAFQKASSLVEAWSDVVVPIATRLQVEIGSDVLFRTGLGYLASAAYSSGDRNTIDFTFLRERQDLGKKGEIHTHPDNNGFSGMTAVGMPFESTPKPVGSNNHGDLPRYFQRGLNGYVALPNGAIYGWEYSGVRNRIDRSGPEALGDSVNTIRPAH
ncbi:MAG: RHS repeat-associated core domain-containing protein [Luteibacter jiangsuensis]